MDLTNLQLEAEKFAVIGTTVHKIQLPTLAHFPTCPWMEEKLTLPTISHPPFPMAADIRTLLG